ncbi:MAG TPA: von Willebrand factor type A domain-containing protein [Vicinamibacterales bacterium]|nr:von Willebrand factor type A domain-containing protein [Vicinamibacterales bacterium]
MSRPSRTYLVGLAAVAALAAAPILSTAQGGVQTPPASQKAARTTITGVVRDKDGLVPGATVELLNLATGEKAAPIVTNEQGAYSFPGVVAGKYKVTVTMQNYKKVEIEVTVSAGIAAAINTVLEIGRMTDTVTVTAASDLVRADTPTVSQSVNADYIQTLPRNDRNALTYLMFLPGVTTVEGAPKAPATIAGLSTSQLNITIDGVTTNAQNSNQGLFTRTYPRLDAVEEVTLRSEARNRGLTGETYTQFEPNRFSTPLEQPLSTFAADVDTASYSNVRRFLSSGELPPSQAVRIEELVNYFHFGYAAPRDGRPIALTTEVGECPWAPSHRLVLIGARASAPPVREVTGRNIVLLIDVSGSMEPAERLPMIKTALGLFVDTLKPNDTLAIVTYAGSSGLALPPTPIRYRDTIQRAIAGLTAGGSTNGGDGLILAYRVARQAFIKGGVNRVILATDGDFNVGITSQQDLLSLIQQERQSGVFLSVFGVGSGNLKDATMEMLADRGNGHYAYLDSLQEARRVLIKEGDATIETVAKDVKFQVEFNPATVLAYKLLGYEDRALAARDFNDDRKDGGEMGAGHTVTVLYEIVPVGADRDSDVGDRPRVDPLKYQPADAPIARRPARPVTDAGNGELLTVKARYKLPDSDTSELISRPVRAGGPAQYLPMASAVAEFGLLLRDAPRDAQRWDALAWRTNRLTVPNGGAAELDNFKELVATARGLARIR